MEEEQNRNNKNSISESVLNSGGDMYAYVTTDGDTIISEVRMKSRQGHSVPNNEVYSIHKGRRGCDSSLNWTHGIESILYGTGFWDNCSKTVTRI